MHIINSSNLWRVINREMVRCVQGSANSTERIIKFRVVASFDTIQAPAIIAGDVGADIKFKVCTNWTFRRDDERDDWKKRWVTRQREANRHSSQQRTATPPFLSTQGRLLN